MQAASNYGHTALGTAIGSSASPVGHSSSDDFEGDDDAHAGSLAQWQPAQDSSTQSQRTAPLQKRRRVTRACDECRRKKIKCDGKQPCTHCTVYSYGEASLIRPIHSMGIE